MNKGQGLAVGVLVAAAFMFRPVSSSGPSSEPSKGGEGAPGSAAPAQATEGPWIASCNYWAPARQAEEISKDPEIQGTWLNGKIQLHVDVEDGRKGQELGCSAENRWGFPEKGGPTNVTAIIATVPDPVHTHLPLIFDRTVDAILQAAADNGFVSSYYWLPWKNRVGPLKAAESVDSAEPGHDPERERQPGLIILKKVREDTAGGSGPFGSVIYLFLVAETPTQGIDGFQFQCAFAYETELATKLKESCNFSRGRDGSVSIFGPLFSGSVASLSAAIKFARESSGLTEFHVTGAISTDLPVQSPGVSIQNRSFNDDRAYSTETLFDRIAGSGKRVALLVEDNTTFGEVFEAGLHPVLVMQFPREISLLRNANAENQPGGAASIPSPYLPFSLKDNVAQDSVPQFSPENTPVSQEAQLMAIARELHRFRSEYIAIVSTNVLDQVFLAQFLHRACPDARLVFFGSDLLLVREVDNVPFIGSVTVTPHPLIGFGTARRTYTSSLSEAIYYATSYVFWDSLPHAQGSHPQLPGYRNIVRSDILRPPLWATAIGSDGYYPVGILTPVPSRIPTVLPGFSPSLDDRKAAQKTLVYPARLWDVLWGLVFALCALHTVMLWAADYWSPFTRDLAVGDNDEPRRRSMFIHVATAMLFSMAFIVACPVLCLWLSGVVEVNPLSKYESGAALLMGALAVVAALHGTRAYLRPPVEPKGEYDLEFFTVSMIAAVTLFAVPALWAYLWRV